MPTSKDLTDLESQVRKSTISAESFKRGSSMDPSKSILGIHKTISSLAGHLRKVVIRVGDLEKNVNNQAKKITSLKNISKTQSERISGENIGAKLPGGSTDNVNESLKAIADSLTSIADILAGGKKLTDATAAFDRRKAEQDKRALTESKLEKRFDGLKKAAEKIIAPVKSILDRIIDFFVTVFLGRVVYKLLEWFGDPKNADKVKSIIRFVKDFWPALLSAYILFGTSFGRLTLGLTKMIGGFIFQIGKFAIPQLLKLIAKNPVVAGALAIGGTALLANEVTGQRGAAPVQADQQAKVDRGKALSVQGTDSMMDKTSSTGNLKPASLTGPLQGVSGGGLVIPRFSGGGFNFKGMMGGIGAGLGSMFGDGSEAMGGFISGEKGVDKVPAMLSDGEFVMSRGAVQKYGVDTLESMNAAGGGTNKPKIMGGTTYAQGGGYVGREKEKLDAKNTREMKERLAAQEQSVQVGTESRVYGGVDDIRAKYDAKHGTGAYDKESARRRAALQGQPPPQINLPPIKTGSAYHLANRSPGRTESFTSINGINVTPLAGLGREMLGAMKGMSPKTTITRDTGFTPEQQRKIDQDAAERNKIIQSGQQRRDAARNARSEYAEILKDQSHPLHEQAAFGNLTLDKFKQQYKPAAGTGYTPYQSRFAGARDAAFAKAKTIGGFMGVKSQDYYKANTAAKEKQLSGLTSQQRLNRLSYEKTPGRRYSQGKRFDTESLARTREDINRGGFIGQLGRFSTRLFGGEKGRARVDAADKASAARVKQAGAASIGRYFSSSDGKYYKDYNAAKLAQEQRRKSGVKPPVKPAPKYTPAGGGMGGGRGSGDRRAAGGASGPPNFGATCPKAGNEKAKTLGFRNRRGG